MNDFSQGFLLVQWIAPKLKPSGGKRKKKHLKNHRHLVENPLPNQFKWTLFRCLGEKEIHESLSYQMPSLDIGMGLKAEEFCKTLNDRNCFDFAYTPEENDNLMVKFSARMGYMSFIYREGRWEMGYHSPEDTELDELCFGPVTPMPSQKAKLSPDPNSSHS